MTTSKAISPNATAAPAGRWRRSRIRGGVGEATGSATVDHQMWMLAHPGKATRRARLAAGGSAGAQPAGGVTCAANTRSRTTARPINEIKVVMTLLVRLHPVIQTKMAETGPHSHSRTM